MDHSLEHSQAHQVSPEEAAPEAEQQDLLALIIQNIEILATATDIDPPEKVQLISYYVNVKYENFVRTGHTREIEEAINKQRLVLEITNHDDEGFGEHLDRLGAFLELNYERSGGLKDLEEAIQKSEEAVRVTPSEHVDLAGTLNNLGNKLQMRYERTGQMADLETAIEKAEEAVRVTPSEHVDLAGKLSNLGIKLQMRYERTGQMADLERAIEKAEEAVRITPSEHPDLAGRLNNLGNKLERRYERTGQMVDLEMAIEKAEEAVRVTPSDHPDLAGRLNNLGNKLESRYKRTGQMVDLETAIEKAEEAVRVTPSDHPDLARMLKNLGRKQMLSSNSALTDNALSSFLQSWHCHSGIASDRLRSANAAVDLLISKKHWNEAADLAVAAINLLPLMNRRMLSRDDQQHILSMFVGLASKACSLLLESRRLVEESVEILERGRGAILGLMVDDRRDISHIHQLSPVLADEFERLRSEVNSIPSDDIPSNLQEQGWKRRAEAIKLLEECIERIRCVPGLERYLLGASAQELQRQASIGPIVVVNVTDIRSDAIIINMDKIKSIKLPAFSAEELRSWKQQRLTEFDNATFGKKNKKYRAFLSWLWTSCVQTVIDSLPSNSTMTHGAVPTLHLWWIGAGEASNVPFHAAGDHSPGSLNNTVSHVVSSYTPTIKLLQFVHERVARSRQTEATSTTKTEPRKLCVATMPNTPGAADLPGVINELSSLQAAVGSTFVVTHLPNPGARDVKKQLQECHIFHFTGHGRANAVDPSQSCLVLQRSDESSSVLVPDLLSVDDVTRLQLSHAELAYLSACSTAENNNTLLADEVIHLVSGFQVAGFPHVIGSMWPSVDTICADMARLFYQKICEGNHKLVEDGFVARALHSAVLEIRERWWMQPLSWAQYVRFGG